MIRLRLERPPVESTLSPEGKWTVHTDDPTLRKHAQTLLERFHGRQTADPPGHYYPDWRWALVESALEGMGGEVLEDNRPEPDYPEGVDFSPPPAEAP